LFVTFEAKAKNDFISLIRRESGPETRWRMPVNLYYPNPSISGAFQGSKQKIINFWLNHHLTANYPMFGQRESINLSIN
jgi:hypothetical protein